MTPGPDDIGQLADVAAGPSREDEPVEVRVSLDVLDPPAGLLRVLDQVMGSPAAGPQDMEEL